MKKIDTSQSHPFSNELARHGVHPAAMCMTKLAKPPHNVRLLCNDIILFMEVSQTSSLHELCWGQKDLMIYVTQIRHIVYHQAFTDCVMDAVWAGWAVSLHVPCLCCRPLPPPGYMWSYLRWVDDSLLLGSVIHIGIGSICAGLPKWRRYIIKQIFVSWCQVSLYLRYSQDSSGSTTPACRGTWASLCSYLFLLWASMLFWRLWVWICCGHWKKLRNGAWTQPGSTWTRRLSPAWCAT